MKRRSRFLLLALLMGCLIAGWLIWARPRNVDMAAYAPADSLLYLEANRPVEILDAVSSTDAWKAVANLTGTPASESQGRALRALVRWTGLGPIRTVILSRSQVAVVISDLRTVEEGASLNVKTEGAFLIETHTSERRIRSVVEETLKTLAERTYGRPTERRTTIDGVEFVEWVAPDASRQIVSAIFESLVIVGTSEHIVQQCLAVAQRRAASLSSDAELHAMRTRLASDRALTFGYVPPANSARLLSVALPILLGQAPGDSQFQKLITNGATKVFGSVGWTSNKYLTGIEDRYLINLAPSIVERLRPAFVSAGNPQVGASLPNVYSITKYEFANPLAAWQTLKTSVSSQVDALSTILFSSLLKSALLSYGIDDPETFLAAVDGNLQTLRLDGNSERSILVARVRDRASLRQLFLKTLRADSNRPATANAEMFVDPEQEIAAGLTNDLVVSGAATDVRRYLELAGELNKNSAANRMTFFASPSANSCVLTYADDSDRVRRFAATLIDARAANVSSERLEAAIALLPYSVTETRLGERGIERTNRSPLGQFSSIVPLLFPEKSNSATR
jgi:hypothetical protein